MQKVDYVAGFLFDAKGERVALIEKARPEWQKGKLNGIGGHIEKGETPSQAMRREFREETGVDVRDWLHFGTLQGESDVNRVVHFFLCFEDAALYTIMEGRQFTDERVSVFWVDDLKSLNVIPNLRWLIPMAKSMRFETAERFTVTEHYQNVEAIA